jgi:catechol 2,3-dioxygenase-like lactoylglutathione lyase family enzyme
MTNGTVSVRYMVDDVDQAIDFYTNHFGFEPGHNASPAFAEVNKGNLRLLLAGPESSAGRPIPDGRTPEPGAGTASTSSSTTSTPRSSASAPPASASATTSSADPAVNRFSSTTPPATP